MKVLVTAASKHGATEEIARAIAMELELEGIAADVLAPDEVQAVDGYDAVVLGSGVYAGRWMGNAVRLAEREAEALLRRPVWLFSSGPLGDPPVPETDPIDVAKVMTLTGARGHRVIAGRLDKRDLGLGERAIAAVVKAPEGDFRPWDEIAAWAKEIARDLKSEAGVPATTPR
jgi:menaquinone-dependent protoporphyrinogen oxidase